MEQGRIVENGAPEDVLRTAAYKRLLSSQTAEFSRESHSTPGSRLDQKVIKDKAEEETGPGLLREDELEGRPTLRVAAQYMGLGRWRNILCSILGFGIQCFLFLLGDLVLAYW